MNEKSRLFEIQDDEALVQALRERLRREEAAIDPMTAVRLAAARRRALDAVPQGLFARGLALVGGGTLISNRRGWLALPGLAVAALALTLWSPWQGLSRGASAPSAETLEWLAQEESMPMSTELYQDLDLVIWLEDLDGKV